MPIEGSWEVLGAYNRRVVVWKEAAVAVK